jgi:Kef-type K+ transport system membrane component KefB
MLAVATFAGAIVLVAMWGFAFAAGENKSAIPNVEPTGAELYATTALAIYSILMACTSILISSSVLKRVKYNKTAVAVAAFGLALTLMTVCSIMVAYIVLLNSERQWLMKPVHAMSAIVMWISEHLVRM